MESHENATKAQGPPTRRSRVHKTQMDIQLIWDNANENNMGSATRRSKRLDQVCDPDDRMAEVIHWSKEEAKRFVEKWQKFASRKSEAKNEEAFIKLEVIPEVVKEHEACETDMKDAMRFKKYNIQVHEDIQVKDQATLAKYILLLEYKINKKMLEKNALKVEVTHLRTESDLMRFTKEEMKAEEEGGRMGAVQGKADAAAVDDGPATAEETLAVEDDPSSASSDDEGKESAMPQAGAESKKAEDRSDDPNKLTVMRLATEKQVKSLSEALTSHLG